MYMWKETYIRDPSNAKRDLHKRPIKICTKATSITVDAVKTSSLAQHRIYTWKETYKRALCRWGKRYNRDLHLRKRSETVTAHTREKRPVREPYMGEKTLKKNYITVNAVKTIPLAQHRMYAWKETYTRALDDWKKYHKAHLYCRGRTNTDDIGPAPRLCVQRDIQKSPI
jgi:hypothetical protein